MSFFVPMRDAVMSLTLSPILPDQWTPEQRARAWARWFSRSWLDVRPSQLDRLSYANDRDDLRW